MLSKDQIEKAKADWNGSVGVIHYNAHSSDVCWECATGGWWHAMEVEEQTGFVQPDWDTLSWFQS